MPNFNRSDALFSSDFKYLILLSTMALTKCPRHLFVISPSSCMKSQLEACKSENQFDCNKTLIHSHNCFLVRCEKYSLLDVFPYPKRSEM